MPDSLILLVIIFVASLALLVFSADKFINYAENIGLSLGIPSFVIGVTVVALGTSLPELVSSIVAILNDEPGIVIGNVVGSNITNILLVLGAVGVLAKRFSISFNFKKIDLPFFCLATLFLVVTSWDRNFTILEAVIGIFILITYLIITLRSGNDSNDSETPTLKPFHFLWLLFAGFGIYLGAKYNVDCVISIGNKINIPPAIIALTAVALGTSLPELFVSITAIRKNKAEIAVGNVLGSNIFNALLIMGVPRFVGVLEIPESVARFSLPTLLFASLLFVVFTWNKKVNWMHGSILLICYAIFIFLSFS